METIEEMKEQISFHEKEIAKLENKIIETEGHLPVIQDKIRRTFEQLMQWNIGVLSDFLKAKLEQINFPK